MLEPAYRTSSSEPPAPRRMSHRWREGPPGLELQLTFARHMENRSRTRRWQLLVAALAVACFVVGRASLFVATPLGYALPAGPMAGIALIGILLLGARAWPAIWLASFCIHATAPLDMAVGGTLNGYVLAASLGLGATLQALLGALLLRRFSGFPNPLLDGRQVALLLVLGGPVACVVSATVGVITLTAAQAIPFEGAATSWRNWWLADSLGAAVLAPVMLVAFANPRYTWRSMWKGVAIPVSLALVAVTLLFIQVRKWEAIENELQFERMVDHGVGFLSHDYDRDVEAVRGIAHLLEAVGDTDRTTFFKFVRDGLENHPDVQAFEWIPRVRDADRAAFEQRAHADGLADFRFTERNADGEIAPARARDEYFPVYYVEPMAGNQRALGFDLGSSPARLKALVESRDTGKPIATGRITLVQETGTSFGFLTFVPCYSPGGPTTIAGRREQLLGFGLGVFRIGDLALGMLDQLAGEGVAIEIRDLDAPAESSELLIAGWDDSVGAHGPPVVRTVAVGGRRWRISAYPTSHYASGLSAAQSWAALVGGLLLTGLLGGFALVTGGRRATVDRLVVARTTELTHVVSQLSDEMTEREAVEQEREEIRQALERAQKLESIGRLAAGVAHEINTPMQFVGDNVEFLCRSLDDLLALAMQLAERLEDGDKPLNEVDWPELGTLLEELDLGFLADEIPAASGHARDGVDRVTTIVCSLKEFSHPGGKGIENVDLNSCISNTVAVGRNEWKYAAEMVLELDPNLPPVPCVRGEINQVLLNLVINAAHAIEEAQGDSGEKGEIRISTACTGTEIEVRISDTGVGIPAKHCALIFEPFFTTKAVGKGTGQGLALAHSVITKQHGGKLLVESTPGQGTTFSIQLPLIPPAGAPVPAASVATA
ncbi:MAG: signal transduction histidine kinase/integral membrane sensor domain MASE1 [Chlamydiales bacterium]|jgi:signal transduction histidine kinase/integral membrane sensor domain MASE1